MTGSAEAKRLSLATLLAPITESTMEYAGEELHIRWRIGKLTPIFQARANAAVGKPDEDEQGAALLCELLVSWDLGGDDGKPYPITKEALTALPVTFLGALWAFLATVAVPKARSEVLSAGSSEAADT